MNKKIFLFSNLLWGLSIVFLDTFFLYIFRGANPYLSPIFLFLSSFTITLIIEPTNYLLSPAFYIISKFLLLLIHSYLSFLYNPWFLTYIYNGKIFIKPEEILKTNFLLMRSLDSFKILSHFKVGLLEIIVVIIGISSSVLVKKLVFSKAENRTPLERSGDGYLYLLSFGIFSFLLFHILSFFSITIYSIHSRYIFSIYLLISSIIASILFLKPFYKYKKGNKLLFLYPLFFYYISMFLISPIGFLVNFLVRVLIFPFEGAMVLITTLLFFTIRKLDRRIKDETL